MNIQQFQYVLAVLDSKNFEMAAEKCFVTQSTLSTMIKKLEDQLGILIFNRGTKPVSVTTEGRQIIERLRIIINEIDQLDNLVQELKGEMIGDLRIGIIPTIAPYLLPRFLPVFADKFTKVRILVKEMSTDQMQRDLKMGNLDVGILALTLGDKELIEKELFTEPFLIYDCRKVRKVSKICSKKLDYSKLWLLEEGHCLRTQVHKICDRSKASPQRNSNFEFESGSMDSLIRFTKVNNGMTIIPYLASIDFPVEEKGNLIEFEQPTPVRSIGLVTHKHFVKTMLLDELQKVILESVAGLLPRTIRSEIIKPV